MVGFSDLTQPHHYSGGGFGILLKECLMVLFEIHAKGGG